MAYGSSSSASSQSSSSSRGGESPKVPPSKVGKVTPTPSLANVTTTLPGEEVTLVREAFNRKQFNDTVNTQFTELGVGTPPDLANFDPSLATVGDFFTIYQTLFFQIPKEGDVNSHLFLIKESSEYLNFRAQQEEIEALLEEISELRQQNLDLVEDLSNVSEELADALAQVNVQQQ